MIIQNSFYPSTNRFYNKPNNSFGAQNRKEDLCHDKNAPTEMQNNKRRELLALSLIVVGATIVGSAISNLIGLAFKVK